MSADTGTNIQFILGGARSGKSLLAEGLAQESGLQVHYIATAENNDAEMDARITQHQYDRPTHWLLTEEPLDLAQAIEDAMNTDTCVLVDCLTLWVSNWLCSKQSDQWQVQKQNLLGVLQKAAEAKCQVILVSNEVGHGIVPLGELSRSFVDESGWLHQEVAKIAHRVEFVMAGLPLTLKSKDCKKT
jgi:adenosylcobinamide kinase/adenosylcobinamide-phosphate guanylyltransferase